MFRRRSKPIPKAAEKRVAISETREKRGEFEFQHLGEGHIAVYPHPNVYTNSFIPMTGAAVKTYIDVPYLHVLMKLVVIHMDAAYSKSTDAMTVTLELEQGRSSFSKYFVDLVFSESGITVAEFIEKFGDTFTYEPRTYTLSLNTTNLHLVMPVLYILQV